MDENTRADIIDLCAGPKDSESESTGWDPYIFSIFANRKKAHPDERRRKPRTRDASRRRALLLAKGRRRK